MALFLAGSAPPSVLVLGAGKHAARMYTEIKQSLPQVPCSIIGFVPFEYLDTEIPDSLILKSKETLLELTERTKATEIVLVKDYPAQQAPVQQLLNCKLSGIQLSDPNSFLRRIRSKGDLRRIQFSSLLTRLYTFSRI